MTEPRRFSDEELAQMHHDLIEHIEKFERCRSSFQLHQDEEMHHHEKQQIQIDQIAAQLGSLVELIKPLVEVQEAIIGTGKTLKWAGRGVRWLVLTGAAVGAVWGYIEHFADKH